MGARIRAGNGRPGRTFPTSAIPRSSAEQIRHQAGESRLSQTGIFWDRFLDLRSSRHGPVRKSLFPVLRGCIQGFSNLLEQPGRAGIKGSLGSLPTQSQIQTPPGFYSLQFPALPGVFSLPACPAGILRHKGRFLGWSTPVLVAARNFPSQVSGDGRVPLNPGAAASYSHRFPGCGKLGNHSEPGTAQKTNGR